MLFLWELRHEMPKTRKHANFPYRALSEQMIALSYALRMLSFWTFEANLLAPRRSLVWINGVDCLLIGILMTS